jgi:hypothetical protein
LQLQGLKVLQDHKQFQTKLEFEADQQEDEQSHEAELQNQKLQSAATIADANNKTKTTLAFLRDSATQTWRNTQAEFTERRLQLDAQKAENIFNQYRTNANFESNVIEPIIRETVKTVSAQYTAEELVTKRLEYSDKVSALLTERFITKDCLLERFSITNFEFSKAFSQAIEAKVTAVQTAEAAKNKLEQVKFEAQQTIEKAKAEAEAIRIQASAIQSQGGADYVKLQWIAAWKEGGAKVPTFITSENGGGFIMNMN